MFIYWRAEEGEGPPLRTKDRSLDRDRFDICSKDLETDRPASILVYVSPLAHHFALRLFVSLYSRKLEWQAWNAEEGWPCTVVVTRVARWIYRDLCVVKRERIEKFPSMLFEQFRK